MWALGKGVSGSLKRGTTQEMAFSEESKLWRQVKDADTTHSLFLPSFLLRNKALKDRVALE